MRILVWGALISATFLPGGLQAEVAHCRKSASFLVAPDSAGTRKYAPDYDVKMLHLALDVTPDFKARTVDGKATLRFKTLLKPVRELKLDALDFEVKTLTATEKVQGYQATAENIVVTFAKPLAPNTEAGVTVRYHAEPNRGLYFRTPEMGYKDSDTHLFTQGEETEGRNWYPCLDAPSAMFTSEVTCRVPEGMTVISNGRLLTERKEGNAGLKAVHWSQEQPHANYLITLVAGYFKRLEDKCRDIPLNFYTLASENQDAAANSFRGTRDMVLFFEKETGVLYPWPKYDQVCVNDFVAGGMENTSATTLTDGTLFSDETENIETSEGLVAHELAHQWFGDVVTCKDWSEVWLNEGFATYYEWLYEGHHHGLDQMRYDMWQEANMLTSVTSDTNPIVRRTFDGAGEMFGHLSYQKGGWVLHMLRVQLGDSLFRSCIKTYLERHRHGNVVTEDLRKIAEELSGLPFDQFFDQWLYHAHFPELEVNYSWDEPAKTARVTVNQTQKVDANVLLFNVPLTVRFKGKFGKEERTLQVTKKQEDFFIGLKSAPESVRFDPDGALLAKISYAPSKAMVKAYLEDKEDVLGRLLAVRQLGKSGGNDAIATLKRVLNEDRFYGVRLEAAEALRGLKTPEALEALLGSTEQKDARVRRQVASHIGSFYRESAFEYARNTLEREQNPVIIGVALRSMAGYAKPEVHAAILKELKSDSYRNQRADAAIGAARLQDDPDFIQALIDTLTQREREFTSGDFAQGLSAVAYLARNETNKDNVREFLLGYVNSSKRVVQSATLNALGVLGDPKALPVLEKFAAGPKSGRARVAAETSVRLLRAGRKPADDFKNLREEVLNLQKANQELRKDIDELKKKMEPKSEPEPAKPE